MEQGAKAEQGARAESKLQTAERAASVARYYASLSTEEGPKYFTHANFLCYLARTSATIDRMVFAENYVSVSRELLRLAEGPVYLVDGMAFIGEVLFEEYPELTIFRLPLSEAFIESDVHPGIFIETRRFADLHLLSRMRRELKRTGIAANRREINIVKLLLGIDDLPQISA